jgi:hypothetical protein
MAGKVCSLIGLGLLHSSVPFLVRAGIAAGHLHERVAKGDGTLNVIRIGTAMVKAHALESSQRWIGGAVTRDIWPADKPRWLAVPYQVEVVRTCPLHSVPQCDVNCPPRHELVLA